MSPYQSSRGERLDLESRKHIRPTCGCGRIILGHLAIRKASPIHQIHLVQLFKSYIYYILYTVYTREKSHMEQENYEN